MTYKVRPLSDRTWLGQAKKRRSQFTASWLYTQSELIYEVAQIGRSVCEGGWNLIIGIDVAESDLRLDGKLRSTARPESDAVEVAFESKHGPQLHRCDIYTTRSSHQGPAWQHNVRAIVKRLEALRAVERHGGVGSGEQYLGFKALPAGRAMPASHMTKDEAYDTLYSLVPADEALNDYDYVRQARLKAHPDRWGGDHTLHNKVLEAALALGVKV